MHRMLTNRGRSAVRAMIELAARCRVAPVSLTVVANRQDISRSYLEQLFSGLRRHSLVRAVRGPTGGYVLARPADQISVADIVAAVHTGRGDAAGEGLHGDRFGMTSDLWSQLNERLIACLVSVSLQSLVDDALAQGRFDGDLPRAGRGKKRGVLARPAPQPVHVRAPNSVFALAAAPHHAAAQALHTDRRSPVTTP